MQIYLLFAERKSDALQLKILIYRPKGTVCKGFRRKDRRFSYLQGEICGGRVLRGSAGEGSARTAPWRRSVAAGVAGFDRPAGRSDRIAKIADEVTASARAPGAGVQNSGVFCARSASADGGTCYFSPCLIFWCFWIKPKAQKKSEIDSLFLWESSVPLIGCFLRGADLPPFVTKRWRQKCPQGEKVGERPTACA